MIDPIFECGSPSVAWTEASSNCGTPLCTTALCVTCVGGCIAYDGDWCDWFGGAVEEGLMTQAVTIANGTNATLILWIVLPTSGPAIADDVFEARMDGTQGAQYAAYTEISVDISSYSDGQTHA
ncbi:MAG: hypothetical protein GC193_09300 [Cryomorphaceae bacterium]|nr:hypothetical protein [Cryomorphaceae bacterium]